MKGLLSWWYSFTISPHLPRTTPVERERRRYARFISCFALLALCGSALGAPTSLSDNNHFVVLFFLFGVLAQVVALLLNRLGWVTAAGTSCVLGIAMALVTPVFTASSLTTTDLPIYCLFVTTDIVAGALLPPLMVLAIAATNCILICLSFFLVPHASDITLAIKNTGVASLLLPSLSLQFMVGILTFILVQNLVQEVRRADRAEDIAALQKEIAEHERMQAEEKRRLEESIRHIAQIHAQVANGDMNARVALNESNVLWSVAVPLNNLLNRSQQWQGEAGQTAEMQRAVMQLARQLYEARVARKPLRLPARTGTPVDLLIQEISQLSQQPTSPM